MCVCCRLLEKILRYIHSVARCVEDNADQPTAKFWRVLLNKAYEVLDKVSITIKTFPQGSYRCFKSSKMLTFQLGTFTLWKVPDFWIKCLIFKLQGLIRIFTHN